jgi:hypothetical protein
MTRGDGNLHRSLADGEKWRGQQGGEEFFSSREVVWWWMWVLVAKWLEWRRSGAF